MVCSIVVTDGAVLVEPRSGVFNIKSSMAFLNVCNLITEI